MGHAVGWRWLGISTRAHRPSNSLIKRRYRVRIRASAGANTRKGLWTAEFSGIARSQTAPTPQNIRPRSSETDSITIAFDPPTGPFTDSISLYNVTSWDLDTSCAFIQGAAFSASRRELGPIQNLVPGHRYLNAVEITMPPGQAFPPSCATSYQGEVLPGCRPV